MDEILNLIESVSEGFPSYFFKIGLSFVRPTVICAILDRTSDMSHHLIESILIFLPFLSFFRDLSLDATGAVCHQFGLCYTYLHLYCADFVQTFKKGFEFQLFLGKRVSDISKPQ